MSNSTSYDVVIIGGAVTGSSTAYHLAANPDFKGRVLVLEKDPSYQRCASALSAASIRQQYSSAINIEISLYGIKFLRAIGETLAVDGDKPDIQFHEGGYLFLAGPAGRPVLVENHALQTKLGADILFLEPDALRARFPWLSVDGVAAGSLGPDRRRLVRRLRADAGVPAQGALAGRRVSRGGGRRSGTRQRARERGAARGRHAHRLRRGRECGGCRRRRDRARRGCEIPIHNKKRMIFTFDCRATLANFPLLIDSTGVYARPEGKGFLCGSAPAADQDPDSDEFEVDYNFFDEVVWPVLAARVPAFEQVKPGRAWAGHYDMNRFDHNVFVGAVPEPGNFYLANGFSGHGLQQSPAIGRGLSELLIYGRYQHPRPDAAVVRAVSRRAADGGEECGVTSPLPSGEG